MDGKDNKRDVFSVEVLDVGSAVGTARSKLGEGVEYISGSDGYRLCRHFESVALSDIRTGIETLCTTVNEALANVAPEACTVELNLGFKAGTKIPALMSGEANAAIKITLSWKRQGLLQGKG